MQIINEFGLYMKYGLITSVKKRYFIGENADAPEGWAGPAPLVASVVSL